MNGPTKLEKLLVLLLLLPSLLRRSPRTTEMQLGTDRLLSLTGYPKPITEGCSPVEIMQSLVQKGIITLPRTTGERAE